MSAPTAKKPYKAPKVRALGRTCKPPPIGCGLPIGFIKNPVTLMRFKECGLCRACQDKVYKRR